MVVVTVEGYVCRAPVYVPEAGDWRFAVRARERRVDFLGRSRETTSVYRVSTATRPPDLAIGERVRVRGRLAHWVWRDRSGQLRFAIEVMCARVLEVGGPLRRSNLGIAQDGSPTA